MLRIARSSLSIGLLSATILGCVAFGPAVAASHKSSAHKTTDVKSLSIEAEKKVTPEEYREFRDQIAQISKLRLDDPKNINRARELLIAHDERELSHGWVAQCSEIASHDDKFDDGVERAAHDNGGKDRLIAKLKSNPNAVFEIPGWQSAARSVSAAVARDAAAMQTLSFRFSEIAYGHTAKEADYARQAQANGGGVTGAIKDTRNSIKTVSPVMAQILALGAVMELSKDNPREAASAATVLAADKENDQCLRWSDLNLKQCLAAARDNSERAYCLGQEGVGSRAQCWNTAVQPSS
ncbi:MAG TPA: hypothetical protein VEH07_06390 [Alphaproteobacteria bacterium]|nr:hypothetical protein [Alphaproteobacteria bacterium]